MQNTVIDKVTIVQKWNGHRPSIPGELLEYFEDYLIQKKIEEENNRQKILNLRRGKEKNNNFGDTNCYYYDWIETKVLQTPISDYRKLVVGLVLAPYFVVIRKLSYEESYKVIYEWLMKCNSNKKIRF